MVFQMNIGCAFVTIACNVTNNTIQFVVANCGESLANNCRHRWVCVKCAHHSSSGKKRMCVSIERNLNIGTRYQNIWYDEMSTRHSDIPIALTYFAFEFGAHLLLHAIFFHCNITHYCTSQLWEQHQFID